MTVKITRLTERESRVLHEVERLIQYWGEEIDKLNYTSCDETQLRLCVSALDQFEELRNDLLRDGYDY